MDDCKPLLAEAWNRRSSPASAPGGWVEWMQNIDAAMKEPIFQEARALMGTENYGQDVSLLQALRLVRRRMLAAAPTPPVSEARKDAELWRDLVSHQKFNNVPAVGYAINQTKKRQARQGDKP